MSDPTIEQSHDLAHVLSRINQLIEHNALSHHEDKQQHGDIPLLTEIYTPSLAFTEDDFANIDVLNKVALAAESASSLAQNEVINQLIAEMRPLIQIAIKKAVLEESVKAEKLLTVKLERELMQALKRLLKTHVRMDR